MAKKKEFHCKDKDVRMRCPDTCSMCADSLTVAPTPTPQVECKLEARLSFPALHEITGAGKESAR